MNDIWSMAGVIVTVIFALHKITSDKLISIADGQEKEAARLREDTNKTEKRLEDSTLRAETKMKEEADKVREQFLANNSAIKNEMDIRFREVMRMIEKS